MQRESYLSGGRVATRLAREVMSLIGFAFHAGQGKIHEITRNRANKQIRFVWFRGSSYWERGRPRFQYQMAPYFTLKIVSRKI
jgi:hypothetical protein